MRKGRVYWTIRFWHPRASFYPRSQTYGLILWAVLIAGVVAAIVWAL